MKSVVVNSSPPSLNMATSSKTQLHHLLGQNPFGFKYSVPPPANFESNESETAEQIPGADLNAHRPGRPTGREKPAVPNPGLRVAHKAGPPAPVHFSGKINPRRSSELVASPTPIAAKLRNGWGPGKNKPQALVAAPGCMTSSSGNPRMIV